MEQIVVKTVAAFLNSEAGGTLLIGVEDGGAVLGLEHDFKTLGKRQDRDGYENFLTTLLLATYGKDSSPLIQITFHSVDGKDVCRVVAKPSPKPVFIKDDKGEHLFIRAGNSTRLLSTKEAIDFCKIRWKA
jgi:predicted HTH transcriptional regulator